MWVFHNDYYLKLRPDPWRQLLVVSLIPSLSRVLLKMIAICHTRSLSTLIILLKVATCSARDISLTRTILVLSVIILTNGVIRIVSERA